MQTQPPQSPPKNDPSPKFWDKIADRYAKQPVADEASYQKKLQVTQGYFRPDMELLEIGCGTGSTAIIHAPHIKHIRATDISAKMLDIAQGKADAQGITNISFEQYTVEQLPLPDQPLDMVLGLSILHLLEDKEAAIRKIHNLLKPGGLFVSSTTCIADAMPIFKFIAPIGKALGFFPTVKVFGVSELEQSIRDGGFEIDYQWQPAKDKAVFIVAKKP